MKCCQRPGCTREASKGQKLCGGCFTVGRMHKRGVKPHNAGAEGDGLCSSCNERRGWHHGLCKACLGAA